MTLTKRFVEGSFSLHPENTVPTERCPECEVLQEQHDDAYLRCKKHAALAAFLSKSLRWAGYPSTVNSSVFDDEGLLAVELKNDRVHFVVLIKNHSVPEYRVVVFHDGIPFTFAPVDSREPVFVKALAFLFISAFNTREASDFTYTRDIIWRALLEFKNNKK